MYCLIFQTYTNNDDKDEAKIYNFAPIISNFDKNEKSVKKKKSLTKEELIKFSKEELNFINEDILHYKKIKKFYNLLEKLYEKTDEKDLWTVLILKFIDKLENLEEEDLNKYYWKIKNFKEFNKKKYIKKVLQSSSTIYEFEDHYEWYINDTKIDLEEERMRLFKSYEIKIIYIDGVLRKNYNEDDILHAEKIKIILNKKDKLNF